MKKPLCRAQSLRFSCDKSQSARILYFRLVLFIILLPFLSNWLAASLSECWVGNKLRVFGAVELV